MLQNADDAQYDDDVEASVKFSVSSNELIIGVNECGFTLPNVIALCDTGKSSKVNDVTTTGEKGFGFKSVFKIADVVHVRSGFWSFRFEKYTDDGLGMITPLWTDTLQAASQHDGTRIRLEYCDSDEFSLKEMISQFEQLPKSILFSTRQVSRLDVKFEDVLGRNDSISFCVTSDLDNDQIQIESMVTGTFEQPESETAYFRVFEQDVAEVPAHKLRVWDGLSSLSKFQVLSQIYGDDERAAAFFRTFLEVQDAKSANYLDELEDMSISGLMPSRQKLVDLYGRLSDMCWETETKAYIK